MSRLSLKRDHGAAQIFLDEDVYVVIGDSGHSSTPASVWATAGSYGPVPKDGIVGRPQELLGSIGAELWKAKRQGQTVRLVERCEGYSPATALLWAADCVEHFAKRVYAVDGNVTEALALARRYATEHVYNPEQAHSLIAEIDKLLKRFHRGGVRAVATSIFGLGLEVGVGFSSWGATKTNEIASEAEAMADADLRPVQVALLRAAKALCGADPLLSAREAAHWCREAAAKNDLAKQETTWQAEQLLKYLEPAAADQAQAN